jgi:hypothetical protein
MSDEVGMLLGAGFEVHTTSGRGFTPEEIAERAIKDVIYIGDQTHPAIRDQAREFSDRVKHVLIRSMYEAIQSNNTTLANKFTRAGHSELIPLLYRRT